MQVRTVTIYQVEMSRAELDLIGQAVYDQRESYGPAFRNVAIEFDNAIADIREQENNSQPIYPAKSTATKRQ